MSVGGWVDDGASDRPGWFMGCGRCGGNRWVKNAAVCWDKQCDSCITCGTDDLVNTELGWCQCGNPEKINEMMLAYLLRVEDVNRPYAETTNAELLLAYIADDIGWVDHGNSIYGCWLTDDGKEALWNLAVAMV